MRVSDVKTLTLAAVAALLAMSTAVQAQGAAGPASEARLESDRASPPSPGMTVAAPMVAPVAGAESGSMASRPAGEPGKAEPLARRTGNPTQ